VDCTKLILEKAKQNSNSNLFHNLLNAENSLKRTALGNSAIRGNSKLMEILLDSGTGLNLTKSNETIFHILAKSSNGLQIKPRSPKYKSKISLSLQKIKTVHLIVQELF